MSYYLYLDDVRHPKTDKDWIIVRTYKEFVEIIDTKGLPQYISFDFDLGDFDSVPGEERTGLDSARYVIDYIMDHELDISNFEINVHSANCVGGPRIAQLFENFFTHYT